MTEQQPSMTSQANSETAIPVLILNWNGYRDTCRCLDALLQSTGVNFHIVVADNGSDGDDFSRLNHRYSGEARITLSDHGSNLGFTRGMNRLLRDILEASARRPAYVALLNNDAVPEPTWLAALVEAVQATGAGAVASRMLRLDDPARLDNAGHLFLNTGEVLPRGAGRPAAEYDAAAEIPGVCAGACLFSTAMLDDIGLFDEFFVTGYEDAELGLRAMLAGYRQVYAPAAVVRHRIGASLDKVRDFNYAVRLQVNINYTYLKLMPLPVIAWNAPWILAKTVALLFVPLVLGRRRLLAVQLSALAQTLRLLSQIPGARRTFGKRRITAYNVLCRQRFFFRSYRDYFRRYVLGGERTVFER